MTAHAVSSVLAPVSYSSYLPHVSAGSYCSEELTDAEKD